MKPKINENGLVECTILQAFGRYNPSMKTAGFPPEEAIFLKSKGAVDFQTEPMAEGAGDEDLTIPSNWRDLHHTQIIALAKKVLGEGATASLTKDAAIEVIENAIKAEGN